MRACVRGWYFVFSLRAYDTSGCNIDDVDDGYVYKYERETGGRGNADTDFQV